MLGLLTLVIVTLITALSVSREREQGTLEQIIFTPFTPFELFIGKLVPAVLIGLLRSNRYAMRRAFMVSYPLSRQLPGALWGHRLAHRLRAGIGLTISSLAATLQQSVISAFFFIIPAILLSGFVTPLANMAPAIRWLAQINPLCHFISLSRMIFLEGAGFLALGGPFLGLALLATALLTTGLVTFSRQIYR